MSVAPPTAPQDTPRPVYVLPNTQHIRVNQGKRGREDEDDSVSVVDSPKRVKPLEPVVGSKSTPRAIKDARKSRMLRTRVQPSIKKKSECLDAILGYDSEKHYEYGSDTDEEDPPSDPDEPMLSPDEDSASPEHDDKDHAMTDISEETFRAEIDQIFVGSDELVKTFFFTESDSDSDGELADDESEIDVNDADKKSEPKSAAAIAGRVKAIEWERPGPSPLRNEMHLAPDAPKKTAVVRKNKDGYVPIARSSHHPGVDRESTRKDAINRRHCWRLHLPSTDAPVWWRPQPSPVALGKRKALEIVPEYVKPKCGMGLGTPPRFRRWEPLTPPPSRYVYSTFDHAIPFKHRQFGQAAFHGAEAWGVLQRTDRQSTQAVDGRTFEGFSGPLRLGVCPVIGPTRETVEVRADRRALQHWRAHGMQLERMHRNVPRENWKFVTTGVMVENEARMQALQLTERARAPSPEPVVDEDVSMDMVLFEDCDFEELGPWMPWQPEFVVGGTWCR
ncbi:hypothetical protein GSI_09519 [Ganoderma sinense ZZ0214-1]|uniref:Uncharacterized protein n=1 Tax=Ganoderma sinense ZZ0214-1 TaxID=1077348 RepID=A0A2G8S484_9APHY|nr:hypothetical protein GSI_09519 [Ganoderma sinense ZZ0214-1]